MRDRIYVARFRDWRENLFVTLAWGDAEITVLINREDARKLAADLIRVADRDETRRVAGRSAEAKLAVCSE